MGNSRRFMCADMITALCFLSLCLCISQSAVVITSSSDIRVENINGVTTIYLDGRPVDLTQAKVIEETDELKTLEPAENDNYVVTVDKRTDSVLSVRSKDGAQVFQTTLTPEQEEAFFEKFQEHFSRVMNGFRRSMEAMSNSISSLWI